VYRKPSNNSNIWTIKGIATEKYEIQKTLWPKEGKHILAQYDDKSILVYQAYNKEIGLYAIKHQKFEGCPNFSPTRMTWIKTNFLWMMYRSGWGNKDKNQVVTLGIWLKISAFEKMLDHVTHSGYKPDVYESHEEYDKHVRRAKQDKYGFVRLQWDPDHSPGGSAHPRRRAIQLGLKGVQSFISGEDIVKIVDLSDFVTEQSINKGTAELVTPRERVFTVQNKEIAKKLRLSEWNENSKTDDGIYDNSYVTENENQNDDNENSE